MTQTAHHPRTGGPGTPVPPQAAHVAAEGRGRPSAGQYVLDPDRTSVTFTTRHLFGLGTVRGRTGLSSGSLVLPGSGDGLGLTATLDAGTFDTGSIGRDRAVRSPRFLDTARHPAITVSAERWTASPSDDRGAVLQGQLTVRGTTAPVLLELTVLEQTSSSVKFRATTTVDRYLHGVSAARGLADRYVMVTVVGVAVREQP